VLTKKTPITLLSQTALLKRFNPFHVALAKRFFGQESVYKNYSIRWVIPKINEDKKELIFLCSSNIGSFYLVLDNKSKHIDDTNFIDKKNNQQQLFFSLLRHSHLLDAIDNALRLDIKIIKQISFDTELINTDPCLGFELVSLERPLVSGTLLKITQDGIEQLAQNITFKHIPSKIDKKLSININLLVYGVDLNYAFKKKMIAGDWVYISPDKGDLPFKVLLVDNTKTSYFIADIDIAQFSLKIKESLYGCKLVKADHASKNSLMQNNQNTDIETINNQNNSDQIGNHLLDLQFEIGRLQLSISELLKLAPGHIIELGRSFDEYSVHIYSNNSLVAKGELALLGQALCVRVSSVEQ
jgi:flagellar motor switch/type III secretory pathway protein FliN